MKLSTSFNESHWQYSITIQLHSVPMVQNWNSTISSSAISNHLSSMVEVLVVVVPVAVVITLTTHIISLIIIHDL